MKLFEKQRQSQRLVMIAPTASVAEAAKVMAENSVGSVLVMEGERLAGIFTERDLLNRVVSKGLEAKNVKISDVMSKNVITVDVEESLDSCYDKMQKTRSRHVPIVDGGKVVGMVTMRNILEWLWKEIEEENVHLKRYIQQS
jgi:CBS domain-containing protein